MSTNFKIALFVSVGVLLLHVGCAGIAPAPVMSPKKAQEPPSPIPSPEPADRMEAPAPRTLAAFRLTEQAQVLLESNRPDDAIRILEKSLNMDPHNGRNYYFLAEAWILKGDKRQAIEFNRLAGIYLNEDALWNDKIQWQRKRIENISEK